MNLGIETETLEFKKSTGELKEAVLSICAILNKHQHGELYFGVKPDGTVIGQVVTEESLREVSQKIKNFIEPKIYPEFKIRSRILNDKAERPIRRNPKIARMLYYSKDIESFGTGLKRIAEACDAAGVKYEFKKMKSGFVVCFYRSEEKADKSTDKVRISADKVRINMDKLTPVQVKIVEFLLENKKITNKEVQKLLGVKDSRALKILKEMTDIGVLVKHGKLKGSYYVLNAEE